MQHGILQFRSPDDVRQFVNETFCKQYQLKHGAFHMSERILLRGGKPCGIYYCLHGPRAVKFTAIWETEGNQILFYGSSGKRFHKMQIMESPSLERHAA